MKDVKFTIMVSERMDTNKKEGRNEGALIRTGSTVRENLNGLDKLVLSSEINTSKLEVFKAFSDDIRRAKKVVGHNKVLFMTGDNFEKFTGLSKEKEIAEILVSDPNLVPKIREKLSILIGADPEFLLFDSKGKVIRANSVIPKEGKIGSDGAMIEVRPDPAQCPSELITNINNIFSDGQLTRHITDFQWKACIYHKDDMRDYPVGGHIHVGNPLGISKFSASAKKFLFAVVNKVMDELLSIPMIKLDGTDLGRDRRSNCQMAMGAQGYGFFGEWRECDGRLEHRTLSGLWLMHPEIARCVVGTAKAITEEAYSIALSSDTIDIFKPKGLNLDQYRRMYLPEFDSWDSIELTNQMGCTSSSSFMISMLNHSKARSVTKKFIDNWYIKVKKMSTYKKYSSYIDGLYTIVGLPKTKINEVGFDIKENWLNGKKINI